MVDSDSSQDCCKRCSCMCSIVNCFSQSWDFLKRKCIGICFLLLCWAGTIAAFILIKDPDWNIAVVPYFCALVACALVSIICKRGHYDQHRLTDIYSQASRRPNKNADFGEVLDSEVSPLLSGTSRNVRTEIPYFRPDSRPLEHAEELFQPAPVIVKEQKEVPRDTQVTVQADVHRTRHSSSPKKITPELPRESFSTASGSDPQNSSAAPDSGIALQSTAQSTSSVSGGPRPQDSEQPQQNPASPISPPEKSTRF